MPGVHYVERNRTFEVHRTHLPLLTGGPEILSECTAPRRTHASRSEAAAQAGITLRVNQQTGLDFIEPRHGVLLADEMRLGKGQPASAGVLTPSGWRRLGDLRINDEIIDPDGGRATVLGVYPKGAQPVYRVTTSDGAVVECDEDHLWLVQTSLRAWQGYAPRVLETRELIARGLQRGGAKPYNVWILPQTTPVDFDPVVLPLDPYVLGLLLGDGSFRNGIAFSSPDAELHDVVANAARTHGHRIRRDGIDAHYVGSSCWRDLVRRWGLWDSYSHEKFVPEPYLRGHADDRLALLRGLMDTDGYAGKGTTEFYTTSPRLRDAVVELVRSLGGIATVGDKPAPTYTHKGAKRVGRPCFVVRIRMRANPFKLTRKANRWAGPGQTRRTISAIEKVRAEETICIRVSSKRSLYITDGYVVTHNTLTALLAHDPARGPLIVVAPLSTRAVWLEWMRKLWPDVEPLVLRGRTIDMDALTRAPIIFGHYDILAHHRLSSVRAGTLIVDEAHLISNRRTDRTKAIFFYASIAHRTILLTGTPLWNTSRGLWSLLISANPGAWGSEHAFAQRYCLPQLTEYGWKYTGVSNEAEWKLRRDEVVIGRRWQDVAADLPPTQWTTELVDLGPKDQLKLDELAFKLRRNEKAPVIESLNYYRQATGAFKVPLAVDYARRVVEGGDDLVVWVWHRKVGASIVDKLMKDGIPARLVTGDVSSETQRTAIIDAWKTSSVPSVLVISIDVGQVGIDLSRAHHALFVELSWNPVELSQAAMRTFSPTRPMEITYLVLDHEIDRALVDAVITKIDRGSALGVLAAGSTFSIPLATPVDDDVLLVEFAKVLRVA